MKKHRYVSIVISLLPFVFIGLIFVVDILAFGGSTGTCMRQVNGEWIAEPCGPAPSGGSSGGGSYSVPSGPSPAELERRRREWEANDLNKKGIECVKNRNYDCAIQYYEKALQLDPSNEVIRRNLRKAKGKKANKIGVEYWDKEDYGSAAQYYREALSYWPDNEVFIKNLNMAEEMLEYEQANLEREQKERERQVAEAELQRKLSEAKVKTSALLESLSDEFGSSGDQPGSAPSTDSLEFMGSNEPLFSKGSKSSAPVDLRFMEPDEPLVNDSEVSQKDSINERQVQTDLIRDAAVGTQTPDKVNRKTEVLLDALQVGNGDWEQSLKYLVKARNRFPDDLAIRDANFFLLGLTEHFEHLSEDYYWKELEKDLGIPEKSPELDYETWALFERAKAKLYDDDNEAALELYRQAHKRSPKHMTIRDMVNYLEGRIAAQQTMLQK